VPPVPPPQDVTYPDWWPGNHSSQIKNILDEANSLGVMDLYKNRLGGNIGPILLVKIDTNFDDPVLQARAEQNMNAAKITLARFDETKLAVWSNIFASDRMLLNRIIDWLADMIKRAELRKAARTQNDKAAAARAAAVAAAAPAIQTNYLITLENPIEASILLGILNNTGMMHIRHSRSNYPVLSTGPWGSNIKTKSTNNDGYIDALDLLKLPINPRQVITVDRKMLEAGMDEYGTGYILTFTHRTNKKVMLELELGSPTSVAHVDVDRANSEIDDIGRNIRYSATVVSYEP